MSILNFLVSITCFFLILFALHLFFAKSQYRTQNRLLAVLLFTRSGHILVSLLMSTNQQKLSFVLFQSFTPLYFAAPACFYLYIRGFLGKGDIFKKTDWLHFIPALAAFIHVIPWPGNETLDWHLLILQFNEYGYLSLKAKSGLFPPYFQNAFRPILTVSYLVISWWAVMKSKILKQAAIDMLRKDWMIFILRVATFFQLMGMTRILFRVIHVPLYNPLFIFLNCSLLLCVFLYALHKPHIFYGSLLVAIDWRKKEPMTAAYLPSHLDNAERNPKKRTSPERTATGISPISLKKMNITDGQLEAYIVLMKNAMEEECLFLNPDLQIMDLANKINIPVHHCSFVINSHLGKNFRDWINGYRVGYFLSQYPLLNSKMTILAIAQEAGFKNQATFYNAFKKEKGVMPRAYIAQALSL